MTWFASLRRERKDAYPTQYEWSPDAGNLVMPTIRGRRRSWRFEQAVAEAYERTVWVWKSVETIAAKASDRPFRFRLAGTDKTLPDHPLYRVLNGRRANPIETGKAFRKRLVGQLLLSERGVFVEVSRSRSGDIVRLDLLPPGRTRAVPGGGGELLDRFEVSLPNGQVRALAPDQVRWIRNPHLQDPYASAIPLTGAGLSVEMDDLGRMINVTWMANDGLPRAVIAVRGDISDGDASKLESRFGHGPVDAGKVSVITADGLEYMDLSGKPRDMQYAQISKNAKIETLAAFGVPESQLGNSSDKTYANADREGYAFWTITMAPLLDLIAAEFHDEDDYTLEPYFDTSDVEELQLPQRARRAEAREEVAAGLRSIRQYGDLAGIEVADLPEMNALWIPSGRSPLDQRPHDLRVPPIVAPAAAVRQPAAAAAGRDVATSEHVTGTPVAPSTDTGTGATTVTIEVTPAADSADPKRLRFAGRRPAIILIKDARPVAAVDGRKAAEALAAAFASLPARWATRTAARLVSPKYRKNTRHWQPDPAMATDRRVGTKALDVRAILDAASWGTDLASAVRTVLTATSVAVPSDRVAAAADAGAKLAVDYADRLAADLAAKEAAGATLDELAAELDDSRLSAWVCALAESLATTAAGGPAT